MPSDSTLSEGSCQFRSFDDSMGNATSDGPAIDENSSETNLSIATRPPTAVLLSSRSASSLLYGFNYHFLSAAETADLLFVVSRGLKDFSANQRLRLSLKAILLALGLVSIYLLLKVMGTNDFNNENSHAYSLFTPDSLYNPLGRIPYDGRWQFVNDTKAKMIVYAAYYDQRNGMEVVRLIGATDSESEERVWCRFWYVNDPNVTHDGEEESSKYTTATLEGSLELMTATSSDYGLKVCFVLCPARDRVPHYVSIFGEFFKPVGNLLVIRNTPWDDDVTADIPEKVAICLKPFGSGYDNALEFLEFLELNIHFGVSHFSFYNTDSVGSHVACILTQYMKKSFDHGGGEGKTEQKVGPSIRSNLWNVDDLLDQNSTVDGDLLAFNDCLYRSMYRYKYLIFLDIGEYIIPANSKNLTKLLSSLNSKEPQNEKITSYYFRDGEGVENGDHNDHIAYIVKPEMIVVAGEHDVVRFSHHNETVFVPPRQAKIFHHKNHLSPISHITRYTMHHSHKLALHVEKVYNSLKDRCNLPSLANSNFRQAQSRRNRKRYRFNSHAIDFF